MANFFSGVMHFELSISLSRWKRKFFNNNNPKVAATLQNGIVIATIREKIITFKSDIMEPPKKIPSFGKAILSGTLTGIAAAIVNLIYNIVYRAATGFHSAEIFSFFSITAGSILVMIIAGLAFFFITRNDEQRERIFTFLIIAISLILIISNVLSYNHDQLLHGNAGLFIGFVVITGLFGALIIPYFYRHPRIYI